MDPSGTSVDVGEDEAVVEQQQIVTFEDEGTVNQSTLPLPKSMPDKLAQSGRELRDHSVIDFLERPMFLKNFEWLLTATPATEIFAINFPNDMFNQPAVNEKLRGFTWFRGDLVLRVNVNAQKFQQGRLLVWFEPYGPSKRVPPNFTNLTYFTGFPHVDMDLAVCQSMAIKIPFVAPMTHLNLIKHEWDIGTVHGVVYGALAGGSDTSIFGSIWGHFEDVEVNVPTGAPIYIAPAATPSSIVTSYAQSVNLKAESKATGTISQVARTTGTVARVAASIPGLSAVAAPIAAVADTIGGLASAFGYSKPRSEQLIDTIQIQTARFAGNFNGNDLSKTLAMDATNSIGVEPIFGSGVDEMSLSLIARTPNFYRSFDWKTTDSDTTVLFTTGVSPFGETQLYKTGYAQVQQFTHLAYIARMFQYWRGGIKYRLRFVKTKFHSGRLRVSVVPQGIHEGTVETFDMNKCYSHIIDLKDKSEFEFTVPYTFNAPMLPTGADGSNYIPANLFAPAHSAIVITVLNKLRTPSTLVSPTVNVIVEKSGAEDISFHVPVDFIGSICRVDNGPPKEPSIVSQAQGVTTREDEQLGDEDSVMLFQRPPISTPDLGISCVGETIVSARQLLKRFQIGGTITKTQVDRNVNPYVPLNYRTTDAVELAGYTATDYFTVFDSIFAFCRGGMRLKFYYRNLDPTTCGLAVVSYLEKDDQTFTSPFLTGGDADRTKYKSRAMCVPNRDGVIEIGVPYYNQYSMSPTTGSPLYSRFNDQTFPDRFTRVQFNQATVSDDIDVYRAVGEDFSFGFLTGVPPVAVPP